MSESFIATCRRWWRPPRRVADRIDHRQVTFLELFYDLVYVVVIAEIGHVLATHVSTAGVLEAAYLFVLVWLAWINGSIYHDLHGQNDLRTRTFTFAQMFAVAAMAVFVHSAFGEGAAGFALSFATYQGIVGYLWWMTGVHDPDHRPLAVPYSTLIFASVAVFAASAFLSDRFRLALWALGAILTVGALLSVQLWPTRDPAIRAQREMSMRFSPSAVERLGLFTIIVLGEVIVGVVQGVAGHEALDWTVGATAALGMMISVGLWWLYFDSVSHRSPLDRGGPTFAWMGLHLTTTMGIAASGAATLNVVEHAGEPLSTAVRWLLIGSIAMAVASIAGTIRTIRIPLGFEVLFDNMSRLAITASLAMLALGPIRLGILPTLGLLVALLLAPILYALKIWITVLGAADIPRE